MTIGIIGATGYIGRQLVKELLRNDHEVIAITRDKKKARSLPDGIKEIYEWDSRSHDGLVPVIGKLDALVNLAGYSLDSGRWTARTRELIYNSRVPTTRMVSEAITVSDQKPAVLIQTSAVGRYGTHYDGTGDPPANGFVAKVCIDWEEAARPVEDTSTRLVINRLAPVLGSQGLIPKVKPLFKYYMGGHIGSGKQWFSWVHIDDAVQAIVFELEHEHVKGTLNLTSPRPMMQKDFFREMAEVMHRPYWLHVPSFMVKLVFGKMGEETVLASQRVLPDKLLECGFSFKYPDARSALENLLY